MHRLLHLGCRLFFGLGLLLESELLRGSGAPSWEWASLLPSALVSWLLALGSWFCLLALGPSALGSWLLALGSWRFVSQHLGSRLLALGSWLLALGSWFLALGSRLSATGSWLLDLGSWLSDLSSWWFPPLVLKFSTLGSAVFDGILIGCGVMVVSTLGFGVFEIFLEFSDHGSAVCNGVLLGCGVMVLVCPWFPPSGVVGTFVPIVTSFL